LLVLALAPLSTPALAHPGGHGHSSAPKATEEPKTAVPATYAGVLAALTEQLGAAETALDTFKIADLHRHCGDLRALADAAPGRAPDADAARPGATALRGHVDAIAAHADKGDLAGARAALAEARTALAALQQHLE